MYCKSASSLGSAPRTWTDITYMLYKSHVSWRYYIREGIEPDCESDEAVTCEATTQGVKTVSIWNPLPGFTDVAQDGQLSNVQSLTNFYTSVHDETGRALPERSW